MDSLISQPPNISDITLKILPCASVGRCRASRLNLKLQFREMAPNYALGNRTAANKNVGTSRQECHFQKRVYVQYMRLWLVLLGLAKLAAEQVDTAAS